MHALLAEDGLVDEHVVNVHVEDVVVAAPAAACG